MSLIDAEIVQLGSDDFDKLFEGTPSSTPNANTLAGGTEEGNQIPQSSLDNIPLFDEKDFADEKADVIPDPEKVKADAAAKVEAEKLKLETEKAEADKLKKAEEDKKEGEVPAEQVNAVLKNTVEYLISSGKWVDFEGREDLEVTEEVYAELVAKQDDLRLDEKFSELVDSTGPYGKAIISHIKNGGNPDVVIDIFKEQQQLNQIDTSTEAGKQEVIEKFYKEIVGFSDKKVQADVKRLISEDRLNDEYEEVKERYEKHYKNELAKADQKAEEERRVEHTRKETFTKNIKTVLDSDTTLSDKDKRAIASSILEFKHDIGGGKKVNDFYVKFAEMQADPKKYIDLVRFVMDPETYQKQIDAKTETKIAKKTFNFIKGGAALGSPKAANVEIKDNKQTPAYRGTDFSSFLK